jgi:xylan 1,4-beta-xylosidase
MSASITSLPRREITLHLGSTRGTLELYRHALGQGGINPRPLSDTVAQALKTVKPRLVRIFIQEFFNIYRSPNTFAWDKLDAYLNAFEKTGAQVVASLTIKPPLLFPRVDHRISMPNDIERFQDVIYQLVTRYSARTHIVTHWEILNEPDIGELGGTPYLITDAEDYHAFYEMVSKPILAAYPKAKIGGPAVANTDKDLLPRFVQQCARAGTPLDFLTWHTYSDDPEQHARVISRIREAARAHSGNPELMVTEWNKSFDPISVEELAYDNRRAAFTAAAIIRMVQEKVDWSFYYHIQDQVFYPDEFRPFFADLDTMTEFWNQKPLRFGLFGLNDEIRPQYYVYLFLSLLGGEEVETESSEPDIKAIAGYDSKKVSLVAANFNPEESKDVVLQINFERLRDVFTSLEVYRIDSSHGERLGHAGAVRSGKEPRKAGKEVASRLQNTSLARAKGLRAVEDRETFATGDYCCQVYLPADSVVLVSLAK